MTMSTLARSDFTLGAPIPPYVPHAISVSLPTWQDNVGYLEGEERVIDAMALGYPRFFIHPSVKKLASICELALGAEGERCLPCPSKKSAEHCCEYLINRSSQMGSPATVRMAQYFFSPENNTKLSAPPDLELHVTFFPAEISNLVKMYWQHAGMIVSSRLADCFLSYIPDAAEVPKLPIPSLSLDPSLADIWPKDPFVDENYANKNPAVSGEFAKRTLCRRIVELLIRGAPNGADALEPNNTNHAAEAIPSVAGTSTVTEDDVYLFPTGMSAIWKAHQLALSIRPPAKSVCFGFPYTDTLKILQQWGPGCHFFASALDEDIDALERLLEAESRVPTSPSPAFAIFTEFPSNPLLSCPNLPRLRALADKYDLLLVVDETIGTFVNVEALPYVDILATSLSKFFGGYANATGGSLVLNPAGRHHAALKQHMSSLYEDIYYWEDAVVMEFNSRDFKKRVQIINQNAEAVCDFLLSRSKAGGSQGLPAIKEVFYPKWITRENYDRCRISIKGSSSADSTDEGGFGGLVSMHFTSSSAARAFYDALPCYKGPSLGTNFTLACPYTILAHYRELEWAAEYGVEEYLVRISVGMEDKDVILRSIEAALDAAEAVC